MLTGGTLAASRIGLGYAGATHTSGTAVTLAAVVDWQDGTIRTLDGASMSIDSLLDARNTQSLGIQLNGTGTHPFWAADADQTITINSVATISGTGNLTKSGPGKLLLLGGSSQYTYSGTTNISDGILQVKNQGALPGWNTTGKVSVAARSSSSLDGSVTAGTLALNVGGSGEWTTGNITTILGGTKITFGAGSALGIDTSNAGAAVTITDQITGSKGVTLLGSGTLTLNPSSNNSFTGMTTVLGGLLQLGPTTRTIIPAASGFEVRGGTLDLGGKNITLSGNYSALTSINNLMIDPQLPFLTQPSRVTFAGGVVQSGTITNNGSCTDYDSIYDAQSGTVTAVLAGSVGLRKTTEGMLTLTGNNSYTGPTLIAKGTLVLGHANALGTTGNIAFNNGTLKYATGVTTDLSARFQNSIAAINIDTNGQTITFANAISSTNGSGLKKSGSGTLILTSTNNSYTGGTWIQEGTLQTNVNGALSGTSANDLTISAGASFDLNGTSQTIGNLISMDSGAVSIVNNKSGTQATLTVNASSAGQFNDILADHSTGTGTLALAKTGNGMLTLAGVNTFTGLTTVSNGSLKLASPSGPAMNGNLTINYGTWLAMGADNQFGPNCTLNMNGEMVLQNTIQTVAVLTGGGNIQNDHYYSPLGVVSSGTATLTVNNNVADTFGGVIRDNAAGNGKMAFIKTGTGTLVLTGISTYSGATTITSGTLQLGDGTSGHDGTINSTASILNNATLAFNLFGDAVNYPAISGSGNVTKNGSGTLLMACNNTYTGTTTINSGTLNLMGASGWALNGSRAGNEVIVNSGATLMAGYSHQFGFTGTLANITVNSGGTFDGSAGHVIGRLTLNGNASVFSTTNNGLLLTGGLVSYTGSGSLAATVAQNLYLGDVPNNAVNLTVSVTGTDFAGDLTISGAISSPAGAALTKTGNGTLTLNGANTYGGATVISGGTLKARAASAIPLVNASFESPAYGSGGWAYLTSGSDGVAGGWTSANGSAAGIGHNGSPWVLTAPQGSQAGYVQSAGTQGDLQQIITVASNGAYYLFFSAEGRPYYTSSNLSVQIDGTTITELPASAIVPGTFNTYSIPLNLTAGTHTLTFKATSIGGDNSTAIDQVMIAGGPVSSLPSTTAVNVTSAGARLDIGDVPFVIGSLAGVAGSSVLLNSSLTAGGDSNSTDFAGSISGTCPLTKTGSGTMTLSGSNAYTGSTNINAGALRVMGSLHASSTVTVNSSATLMGNGIVNGPVTVASGATIAPGSSAGTLTVGTANLSGIYACEINGATADRITSTGSITIDSGATLAFSILSTPTLKSYIIASWAGSLTGTFVNVTGIPSGYGVVYDGSLKQIRLELLPYNSWLFDHGLSGNAADFNADPDHDGLPNGLELVLGGEPNPANPGSNSVGLLPVASWSSGNLIFSFKRKVISETAVTLFFQWSTNLNFQSSANDIPVGAASSVTDGVTVGISQGVPDALTDSIVITVPGAKASGGKLFGRLKANLLP